MKRAVGVSYADPSFLLCPVLDREFNSSDDVLHSTHMDYLLSPFAQYYFNLCMCILACMCVYVCVVRVDKSNFRRPEAAGRFWVFHFFRDEWKSRVHMPLSRAEAQLFLNS